MLRQWFSISLIANSDKFIKLSVHIFCESFSMFSSLILIFSSRFCNDILATLSMFIACRVVSSTDMFFSKWLRFCASKPLRNNLRKCLFINVCYMFTHEFMLSLRIFHLIPPFLILSFFFLFFLNGKLNTSFFTLSSLKKQLLKVLLMRKLAPLVHWMVPLFLEVSMLFT